MKTIILSGIVACLVMWSARADFSYQQTSRMTGGAMLDMLRMAGPFAKHAREPIVSTVVVQGHRMATISQRTGSIIDVDKETITEINFEKKTYSVMTFAQMKQMMEDMTNQMSQKKGSSDASNVQFKASAKDTGQTKTVGGLNAKEVMLTLTMESTDQKSGNSGTMDVVSDIWIAPVAGYEEVRKLQRIMAEKLGMMPGQNTALFAQRPEMMKGMADLYREMAKMDGVPVETITKISGTGTGDSSSTGQQDQHQSDNGGALGRLGVPGLGGFGRRKKNTDQQSSDQQQSGGTQSSGTLIEMTVDSTNFSSAPADASKFEVPAGFKQVDPEGNRRHR